MTKQEESYSEILEDLDRYRKQNNYLSIENQTLRGLLLSFMVETRFDPDEVAGGYFKVKEIIKEHTQIKADQIEYGYQEIEDIINTEASKTILDIGRKLIPLHNDYSNIDKIEVVRDRVSIYMYNKHMESELCFTILDTLKEEECSGIFLDSDWASSSNNIQNYDKILYDIATIVFQADDSYQKNNISIQQLVEWSDTAQNPLWEG